MSKTVRRKTIDSRLNLLNRIGQGHLEPGMCLDTYNKILRNVIDLDALGDDELNKLLEEIKSYGAK